MFSKIKEKFIKHSDFFVNTAMFIFIMLWILGTTEVIRYYKDSIELITNNKTYLQGILEALLYIFGILLPYLIIKFTFKHKINFKFKLDKRLIKNILISIAIGFVIQPFGMGLSAISSMFAKSNSVADLITQLDPNSNYFIIALEFGLLPAIIEELIFRDLFFNNLNKRYSVIVSAIISGLFFGIYHMNIQQAVYAFAIGYIFALIYNRTRNVLYVMIIHFTIDFSQTLLAFSLLKFINDNGLEELSTEESISTLSTIPTFLTSALISFLFALWIRHLYKKYTCDEVINEIGVIDIEENEIEE